MRLLLRNATLVDVRAGRGRPASTLLIQDDRIAAVGHADDFGEPDDSSSSTGAQSHVVDLGGAYVVPGLVDPHVHLALSAAPDALDRVELDAELARRNARTLLMSGVTTAADCGGPGKVTLDLKHAIERGDTAGPRLLVSLNPITTPGGHCHAFGAVARGVQSITAATRELLDRGADFVKVMASGGGTPGTTPAAEPQLDQAELEAIVQVAHARGHHVVAHARGAEAIRRAVRAGVDRLEHLTWEVHGGVAYDPRVANEMAERGTRADPTLAAGVRAAASDLVPEARRLELRQQFAWRYPNYRRLAREAGLALLCGSDAGAPLVAFDDFALGPELLVQVVNYRPAEALAAATLWGAQALGVDDSRGALEPGKLADLVVLGADPLREPSALRSVKNVMLGGRWQVVARFEQKGATRL